jgi:hypothetical protein
MRVNYDDFWFRPMKANCFQDDAIIFTFSQFVEAVQFYGHGDKTCLKHKIFKLPETIFIKGKYVAGGQKAKDVWEELPVYAKAQVEAAIERAKRNVKAYLATLGNYNIQGWQEESFTVISGVLKNWTLDKFEAKNG